MKTAELTDRALDWAVTMIEKPEACEYGVSDWLNMRRYTVKDGEYVYWWHKSWAQGGPIIEREAIEMEIHDHMKMEWIATRREGSSVADAKGPTPLVAAMRCYVASRLGDDVDIPEELT